jgi:hypothetical protein
MHETNVSNFLKVANDLELETAILPYCQATITEWKFLKYLDCVCGKSSVAISVRIYSGQ